MKGKSSIATSLSKKEDGVPERKVLAGKTQFWLVFGKTGHTYHEYRISCRGKKTQDRAGRKKKRLHSDETGAL